jgi:hypothetical protein
VDLTHAADASAAAGVPGAPDYDAWNRDAADPEPVDPVQAALAAKARRVQALGPLGEHLAGYGEDDDDEAEDGTHGTDTATATEPEPASPWTRLVDEKTRHPYFWNRATGKTVWTLAETNSFETDDPAVVLNKRSDGTNEGTLHTRDERGTRDVTDATALLPNGTRLRTTRSRGSRRYRE